MTQAIYDIESLCNDVRSLLMENLNTKITQINTEKDDSITLAQLNTELNDNGENEAYVFQSLNGATVNLDPFVFYGVQDIATVEENRYSASGKRVDIIAMIIKEDSGEDINIANRMLRYGRALEEVIEENFELPANASKLKIQSLVPVDVSLTNGSFGHRAIGVLIQVLLA